MVLSTSIKARNAASLSNQNQGGGSAKAGLVPKATSTAGLIAFNVRGLPRPMSFMMLPLTTTVRESRSIGMRFGER